MDQPLRHGLGGWPSIALLEGFAVGQRVGAGLEWTHHAALRPRRLRAWMGRSSTGCCRSSIATVRVIEPPSFDRLTSASPCPRCEMMRTRTLPNMAKLPGVGNSEDRKSTRLTPVTNAHLVCRLL